MVTLNLSNEEPRYMVSHTPNSNSHHIAEALARSIKIAARKKFA